MSNISGFGDMRKKKDEEAKRQELYAGGVDNRGGGSGLSVLGPPPSSSRAGGGASVFDSIVSKAQNPGAAGGSAHEDDDEDDRPVGGVPNGRKITLYRNGFTVDDGPLRDLTSPESRDFIAKLEKGEVPAELSAGAVPRTNGRQHVIDINLNDKRSEDYVAPPPPAYVAFSGGNSLGSSSSSSSSSGVGVFTPAVLSLVSVPDVDESQPTTTLQVRMHDGKKLKIKINQNRSVLQLAAVISRDGSTGDLSFALSAGFPPKDLTAFEATIAEAGLLGAVVSLKKV